MGELWGPIVNPGGGGGGSITESSLYIPGVVADSGVTDNYATITAYLATLTSGGQNNRVLPPGFIGVSATIVPPIGVTLRGSGSSNSVGGFLMYGSTLCPLQTGTPPNAIVELTNNSCGIQDLNTLAENPVVNTQTCPYSLIVNGNLQTSRNIGIYFGTTCALYMTSSSLAWIGSDIYIRAVGTGGALCINNQGGDNQITNLDSAGGGHLLQGGQTMWTNAHFSMGPGNGYTGALITDGGANTFVNYYFDTVTSSSAPALFDRTSANSSSVLSGGRWVSTATTPPTGIPMIQEATNAAAGIKLFGATVQNSTTEFTYAIKGVTQTTQVSGLEYNGTLTTAFRDNPGIGQLTGNFYQGNPVNPVLTLLSTVNSFALANSTSTIASISVPNDGLTHAVYVVSSLDVTSTATGGQIGIDYTFNGVAGFVEIYAANQGSGVQTWGGEGILVDANTTVYVVQGTALTGGAAVLGVQMFST